MIARPEYSAYLPTDSKYKTYGEQRRAEILKNQLMFKGLEDKRKIGFEMLQQKNPSNLAQAGYYDSGAAMNRMETAAGNMDMKLARPPLSTEEDLKNVMSQIGGGARDMSSFGGVTYPDSYSRRPGVARLSEAYNLGSSPGDKPKRKKRPGQLYDTYLDRLINYFIDSSGPVSEGAVPF